MTVRSDQRISLRQAAALIYRSSNPSGAHLQRVAELISLGELEGSSRGTTMDAVAAFLAKAALDRSAQLEHPSGVENSPAARRPHQEPLARVYRETLKDYFLALIFRRKDSRASKSFQRAVLAGQVAILLLLAAAVMFTARTAIAPLAPERAAVYRWLHENHQSFRINHWHPAVPDADGNLRMRVEYHYVTDRRKGIDTDRVFVISGGQVVSVDSEIDSDE